LSAQEVHQLVSETLQAHFNLGLSDSAYEAQDIWDVLIAAAVERITIEMACGLLEDAPSPNTVREAVKRLVANEQRLAELEETVNALLVARLPKKLLNGPLRSEIDTTEIPYHGRHEDNDEGVRRGRAKSGTTHFHCFATLYTIKNNKRYTLAVTLMRRSDKVLDVLKRLLERGRRLGLRLKRLYLDRGFDNNAVVAFLKQQPFPTIIPLTIRGKTGGSRALLVGRKSYHTTYTRSSTLYGEQTFRVWVVCKYSKGRYGRHGIYHFAYLVIGALKLSPQQVFEEFRSRFGIETSYRLMNTMRARTTSTSVALRLFFVALALLLLNLWSYVKWCHLFVPDRGPRQVLHPLLPLARWRLWLWEMVKQRLGFSLAITIPLAV
jgi:putative transposase